MSELVEAILNHMDTLSCPPLKLFVVPMRKRKTTETLVKRKPQKQKEDNPHE